MQIIKAIRLATIAVGSLAVLVTAGTAQAAPMRGTYNPFTLTAVAPAPVVVLAPVVNVPATPLAASGNAPTRGGYTAAPPPSVPPPPAAFSGVNAGGVQPPPPAP